jgi:hypothetical protein
VRKFIAMLAIGACGATGVTLLATPAGASVGTASVCKTLTNLHYTPSSDPTAAGGKANAAKLAKAFNKAAKNAKGNIKNTLQTMSSYFKSLAAGDTTALENNAQAFATAATAYAEYIATKCGPGLPGGVKIPNVPGT